MSRVRPRLVLLALLAASPAAWAHGDLRWTTLAPADIQRLTASPAAFEYAPFLPARLRAARLVQQSDDHLRFDADSDGICEGQADLVGIGAPQWYAVVGRRSHEAPDPSGGREQVDTLEMDWTGRGRSSLVLIGHTPLDRVKTRLFIMLLDVDDNGVPDLRVEMEPPRAFFWVVAYLYGDAALRPGFSEAIDRWRGRLAHQMAGSRWERAFRLAGRFGPYLRRQIAADPTRERAFRLAGLFGLNLRFFSRGSSPLPNATSDAARRGVSPGFLARRSRERSCSPQGLVLLGGGSAEDLGRFARG